MRAARGFTLFELMVVMALLGIAMLLATGGAEPMLRAARERGWTGRLQAELIRARSRARATGEVSVVSFVPEQREIRFETGSRTWILALPAGYEYRFVVDAAAGTEDLSETLLFFPDGTASDVELTLTSEDRRSARLRVVGVTGRIELSPWERPADAEPPA